MKEGIPLNTGDVLRLELGNGIVNAWEIQAFHYGGEGQEGVIKVSSLGIKQPSAPSTHSSGSFDVVMYVPANLIHKAIGIGLLTIFIPNKVADDVSQLSRVKK